MNRRALIARLLGSGAASRADLAKATRMSAPTAGKIVDELLSLGIVQEMEEDAAGARTNGSAAARPGRPGRRVRLDHTTPRFVAIQLGIARTRVAMLPVVAAVEDRWDVTFATPRTAEGWLRALKRAAGDLPSRQSWGVVVSVPGVVDEGLGQVLLAPNLHWIERAHLSSLLQQVWDCPVALVQEIRALALGHLALASHSSGAERVRDFLLVDFADGIGAAAVIGGQVFMGELPLSGELGHTPVVGNDRRCGCGAVGCIETMVSRRGLLESFAREQGGVRSWQALTDDIAAHGVRRWLAPSLDAAGVIIAGALNVLGLRQVILTGDLPALPPCVREHLSAAVARGTMWARFGQVRCQAAERHWAAGLAATAIDRLLVPESPSASGAGARGAMSATSQLSLSSSKESYSWQRLA
jgi:N-acetylglucosamine repressor